MQVKKAKRHIIILIAVASSLYIPVSSQEKANEKLIQFSGSVTNELLEPLQFVHIVLKNRQLGTITDQKGMFSFIVRPMDTILFSAVGYKKYRYIVPDSHNEKHLYTDIVLTQDTIRLKEVKIFPWKTYEEFKQAFLELKLPEEDIERARRNIALIKTQIEMDRRPIPELNYRNVMKEHYYNSMIQGQFPSYNILNPLKWAEFLEALKEGKFKNDRKD